MTTEKKNQWRRKKYNALIVTLFYYPDISFSILCLSIFISNIEPKFCLLCLELFQENVYNAMQFIITWLLWNWQQISFCNLPQVVDNTDLYLMLWCMQMRISFRTIFYVMLMCIDFNNLVYFWYNKWSHFGPRIDNSFNLIIQASFGKRLPLLS